MGHTGDCYPKTFNHLHFHIFRANSANASSYSPARTTASNLANNYIDPSRSKIQYGSGGSGSTPPSVPVGTTSKPNVSVSGRTVNVSWSYSGSGTSFDVYVIQSPWDWSGIKYKQNVTGNSCTFWDVDPGYYNVFTVAQPNNRQVQSEWAELIVQEPHTNHSNGGFRYTASEHPHYNYYSCSVCGQELTDGSTERNNNCSQCHWEHAWDEGSVTKPPKVGVDGEKIYTCTICGEKKTEKIPQLPKKWGSLEGDGVTYVVGIPDEGFTVTVKANGTLYFNGQGEPSTGGLLSYNTEDLWPFIESNVTTVIIGEGVTSLRITSLFHRLKNLSKIVLPDSIETISFSLHENPLVKELYIPKNTKNLWLANGAAQNLKAINVDPQNMTYTSIDGVVYSKDMSEIIRCPGGKEGDLVIPDGVTKIDEKAFAYSDKITSVTVPDSVVEFGKACFIGDEDDWWSSGTTFAGKLRVNQGSAAERYAIENEIPYELINSCANGHSWGSGVVTREPTTSSTGEYTYTCTVCGSTRKETIPALPMPDPTPAPTFDPTPEPEEPPMVTFQDVPANAYYAQAVSWAVANGITSGVGPGQFGPDMRCTRAQMVTFLWKAQGQPEPESAENPFVDVKPSDYCYKAVLWAVENGISGGTDSTHFSPSLSCDRSQAVTFIWRTEGKPEAETRSSFSDVSSKSYYAKAIDWAVEYGIVNGVGGGKYDPKGVCSRAQIVTMLYRDAGN